jgi:hypothetical protein
VYGPPAHPEAILQGDVFRDVVVPRPSSPGASVAVATGPDDYKVQDATSLGNAFAGGLELCLIECSLETVIVVSQSCDIAQRGLVAVAPVKSLESIASRERRDAVRRRRVSYLFYLPEWPASSLAESYAHLGFLATMLPTALPLDRRLLSLTDLGRHALGFQIAQFFARPAF